MIALTCDAMDIYFGFIWVEDLIIEIFSLVCAILISSQYSSGVTLIVFIIAGGVTMVVCVIETYCLLKDDEFKEKATWGKCFFIVFITAAILIFGLVFVAITRMKGASS